MIWLRYVTLEDVGRWLWAGWTIDDDFAGLHHGRHAVLMRWAGEGEPKKNPPALGADG